MLSAMDFNVGVPELLLVLVITALVAAGLWAMIDAIFRPGAAFDQQGQSKNVWVILLVVTFFLCGPIGTVPAIYYLIAVRPKLRAA